MKVLILANSDMGLYKFRKELLQEMLRREHQVSASMPRSDYWQALKKNGCKCIETPVDRRGKNPFSDLILIKRYFKLIKKERPELIITYTVKPNIYGGLVSRYFKIPYAMNITGLGTAFEGSHFLIALINKLYRFAGKRAKVIFFENSENLRIFIDSQIVDKSRAVLLSGAGVNLNEFSFAEYPSSDETIHFLFIGRVMKEKGVDELFLAAKWVKDYYDNVVFDIVGPFEENYQRVVDDLQVRGVICYHGYQSDVKPFICDAHCFVLPSYHEGMANTLLECGAMGRPIITCDIHGCMEAVIPQISGFLCKTKSAESLYNAICHFVDLSHEQKIEMGRASYNHIRAAFDRRTVVRQTMLALFGEENR